MTPLQASRAGLLSRREQACMTVARTGLPEEKETLDDVCLVRERDSPVELERGVLRRRFRLASSRSAGSRGLLISIYLLKCMSPHGSLC